MRLRLAGIITTIGCLSVPSVAQSSENSSVQTNGNETFEYQNYPLRLRIIPGYAQGRGKNSHQLFKLSSNGFGTPTEAYFQRDGQPSLRQASVTRPSVTEGTFSCSNVVGNVQETWVQHYTSLLPANDYAVGFVFDQEGNLYVAGYGSSLYTSGDFELLKCDAKGDTIWSRRYNGTGNGYDEATALSVDQNGDVIVTGYSFGLNSGYDYATVKYSPDGTVLWIRRYDGGSHRDDIPTAIAVTTDGGICVTGYSFSPETANDYLTVKYSSDGDEQWTARLNGTGNGDDIPTGIVTDQEGRIDITGYSLGDRTGFDYETVSYDAAGGIVWSDRFNGADDSTDVATSIAADGLGHIAVTGFSYSLSTNFDYTTICYDSDGNRRWISVYDDSSGDDRAIAVRIGRDQQVVVTGSSATTGPYQFATVEYDPVGVERWKTRSGALSAWNIAVALALDDNGRVYITGYSVPIYSQSRQCETMVFDSEGKLRWKKTYNGPGHNDYPSAISLDSQAHVFVAATSAGVTGSTDCIVIRYDQYSPPFGVATLQGRASALAIDGSSNLLVAAVDSGRLVLSKLAYTAAIQWTSHADSEANGIVALAPDQAGNVYLATSSLGANTSLDFALTKFSSKGVLLWETSYNGTGNGNDSAVSIAVDRDGLIDVAGTSFGERGLTDFVVVQYTSDGMQRWVARCNNSSDGSDTLTAMVIDSAGNVIATGVSRNGNSADYFTVKYSPDGVKLWQRRFDGSASGIDRAKALCVDANGNVYVTGESDGGFHSPDYATIKYDADGHCDWISRYDDPEHGADKPVSIAYDQHRGTVYVTGTSSSAISGLDYTTVCYDSTGLQHWVDSYTGFGNNRDVPVTIRIDQDGGIYTTGTSYSTASSNDFLTIKYGPDGHRKWSARFNSDSNGDDVVIGAVVDPQGYFYVVGSTDDPARQSVSALCQYSFAGGNDGSDQSRWPLRYDGPATGISSAGAMAVSPAGNVYVSGIAANARQATDVVTLRYNSDGVMQWSTFYSTTPFDQSRVSSLAADRAGRIYLAGTVYAFYKPTDILLVSYDSAGVQQWTNLYDSPGNSYDFATSLALDPRLLSVCVVGYSYTGSSYDFTTLEYSSTGTLQWAAYFDPGTHLDDIAAAVAIDSGGNVYVGGYSNGIGSSTDYLTVKYNASGVEQWSRRYNDSLNGDDHIVGIVCDHQNDVCVAGWSVGPDTTVDFLTIKYDSSGLVKWMTRSSCASRTNDYAIAVVIDEDDNVIVTGRTSPSDQTTSNFLTIEYDRNGVELWRAVYDGSSSGDDVPQSIAVGSDRSVYVTGKSTGTDNTYDFVTLKYSSTGTLLWSATNSCVLNSDDVPNKICLDSVGNVYVSGTSRGDDWSVITTVKYSDAQIMSTSRGLQENSQRHAALFANYPNPFNPTTDIRYAVSDVQRVSLKVYDMLGREIASLVDEMKQPGEYSVQWDASGLPSGIYFCRLIAGKFSDVKKMLLVK